MTTVEELDRLSSQELHDRAVHRAEHHMDIRFFWRLLELVPVAEAAAGEQREATQDAALARAQLADAMRENGDPKLLDGLRPVFIDYLSKHGD